MNHNHFISKDSLGPEHPNTDISYNNLAMLYTAQGRYPEAELLYKHTLLINEKTLGPEHPSTGTTLNNLALLYNDQGRYAEALAFTRRSISFFRNRLVLAGP